MREAGKEEVRRTQERRHREYLGDKSTDQEGGPGLELAEFQLVLEQVASDVESKITHLVLDSIVGTGHDIESISAMEKAHGLMTLY